MFEKDKSDRSVQSSVEPDPNTKPQATPTKPHLSNDEKTPSPPTSPPDSDYETTASCGSGPREVVARKRRLIVEDEDADTLAEATDLIAGKPLLDQTGEELILALKNKVRIRKKITDIQYVPSEI